MTKKPQNQPPLTAEIQRYYGSGLEEKRLSSGAFQLERARTEELLTRYLAPPPGVILDVGGGAGAYSLWLSARGYKVHLVDPVPLHIEQAREASKRNPDHPIASISLGDARSLKFPDGMADAVLLFGPLYHLTERNDRLEALREARRVVRVNGVVLAVGISRFASTLDGLFRGLLDDPEFLPIVKRDLIDGQHRNPTHHPEYFTTAFFHLPDELKAEVEAAGLHTVNILPVEGPAWLIPDFEKHWRDPGRRERLLNAVRSLEDQPSILGASAHIMVVAQKRA